jgi:hypothetical protein
MIEKWSRRNKVQNQVIRQDLKVKTLQKIKVTVVYTCYTRTAVGLLWVFPKSRWSKRPVGSEREGAESE